MSGFLNKVDLSSNRIELAYRSRLESGLPCINITAANPTTCGFIFPCEPLIDESNRYLLSRRYNPDPKGLESARACIARYYNSRNPALKLSADNIFITASTSEAYSLLFFLLCDRGDTVYCPNIGYPLFDSLLAAHQINTLNYRLVSEDRWCAKFENCPTHSQTPIKAVMITSPHNPTGMIWREMSPELVKLNAPLVVDEVFSEYNYTGERLPEITEIYPELPIFLLNGISKNFALPDLKLGWIVLNDTALDTFGARLEHLNDTFLSANYLTQYILPQIFESGLGFCKNMVAEIESNLRYITNELSKHKSFNAQMPDGGAYLFPRVLKRIDDEELTLRLIENGIYTNPGFFFGVEDETRFTISGLVPRLEIEKALSIIISVVENIA